MKTGRQAGGFTLIVIKLQIKNIHVISFLWVLLKENISGLLDTSGLLAVSYFSF